ncbi:MAG: anthranilate synthase component I family protein [Chitinophagia bacterium]|nr:anthranilate synthase component I family protein [Chitinophagia bacterium]
MTAVASRNKASFAIPHSQKNIIDAMLDWANQFSIALLLHSNSYPDRYGRYELLLGVSSSDGGQFTNMQQLLARQHSHSDWLLGHLGYDLKNELLPRLTTQYPQHNEFGNISFFTPDHVLYIRQGSSEVVIETFGQPESIWKEIVAYHRLAGVIPPVHFIPSLNQAAYENRIEALREHIRNGDCYEINFCNHYHAYLPALDTVAAHKKLSQASPVPFAAYYRHHNDYLMCASPERYLLKTGHQLLSQPIKGTARRGTNVVEDAQLKNQLYSDPKERAENVMIADLVRNDLAITCKPGSVQAEELFGIYSYPQVHQMISTITGEMRPEFGWADAIQHSFPMGSMTGAPKLKVMELIDLYEPARRSLFSGSVGYIDPTGNFDFNVVIRSLFYNTDTNYLSYSTGGAITYDSVASSEWEETRLKALAIERIFS